MIRYPIRLAEWVDQRNVTLYWLDDLFTTNPVKPGYWLYKKPYNTGEESTYDIRYDAAREEFVGTVRSRLY